MAKKLPNKQIVPAKASTLKWRRNMKAKIIKKITTITLVLLVLFTFAACPASGYYPNGYYYYNTNSGDEFNEIIENPFVSAAEFPDSNISLTVNTAGYTQLENYVNKNQNISKDMVKIEEMINYFSYDYGTPSEGETFQMNAAITDTPWNESTKLLTVGMQAKQVSAVDASHNLVFLVDVSGSMSGEDRIGLVKKSIIKMLDILGEDDTVSIITYAGNVATLLDGVRGSEQTTIKNAVNKLSTGGSTAGGSGINEAYRCAFKHQTETNNSRIIIATDGDFNVGASTDKELKTLISENRARGVYMSALGFGMGNLSDVNLQEIVNSGQGTYAFIDSVDEAYSFLSEGRIERILTVAAEEAKAQLSFNPEMVDSYRIIGYENKMLTDEEWEEDSTPAGAIAGGTTVTAIYELKLKSEAESGNIAVFSTKYFEPRKKDLQTRSLSIDESFIGAADGKANYIKSKDSIFIASIVEVGLILRGSQYKENASFDSVLARLDPNEPDPFRAGFAAIVMKLKTSYAPNTQEDSIYSYVHL
jgi:Ca-activated chloride channel family protein